MLIWMQVAFAQPKLDAARPGRDASQIADEVISHLSGLLGANVEVRLERFRRMYPKVFLITSCESL